jgi:hypothetical protein
LELATRNAKQMTAKPLVPRVKTLAGTPIPAKRNLSVVIQDGIAEIVGQSINVGGFELPPDQEEAFAECVGIRMASEKFPVQGLPTETTEQLRYQMQGAMRQGFYLAVLHYADELKANREAAALLAKLARGRKKGGAANHEKAKPGRDAIRKRFRELRKSGFTKTEAREVLKQEARKSFRQIERDTRFLR